jgi:predicted NACHT family NTPase
VFALEHTMEIIKELISKPLEKVWDSLEKEVKHLVSNRLLEYQVEEFERNYYTKTILHRTEPIKLYDFYQPLFIKRYGRNYYKERIPTDSCFDLFTGNQFITLIGTAGSGKSTIVKYLLIKSIETSFKIPIKIELRYLNSFNGNLHKYIEEEIFKLEQLAFEKSIINRLLHSGNFLIFFDGYDELSSHVKDSITKDINDFTKIYNKNYYLLTSRPYTNIELLARFKNYEVCELSQNDMEQFVRKQIPFTEKEIANKIIEAINTDHNNSYVTYLSNPLLLSMFILTFQTYSNIPPKKSTFYKQVFDSLFYLHDSVSKLSWARERKSGLSKEQFEYVLKLFSFISYFKEVFVFEEDFMHSTLSQIKEKKKSLVFENQKLLDDLQIAICVLNKEGLDYVFPHRSLQEYFASLYIVSLDPKNKLEVFKRILDQLTRNDLLELLGKDNFYSLLTEQDPLGVIKNLSLPFLEKINDDLKDNSLPIKELENHLSTLHTFVASFHGASPFIMPLFKPLNDYFEHRHSIIVIAVKRQKERNVPISYTKEETKTMNFLRDNVLKQIKPMIPKTLKKLKNHLEEETKSDTSIIELI